jgi:hypothetical protein
MISNNIDLSSILLADGTGFLADLGLPHITTPTMSKFSHAPPHKSTIAQQFFPDYPNLYNCHNAFCSTSSHAFF